ncbi:hypothetical protein C8R46DRAFT_1140471 [Mycena filopes]|nr:hypothetical protein C8R46DRAFT_1140471 [Mycena filopes]
MSAPPISLLPPPLGNTLGAVFLGMAFSCILFGISSLQVYFYYHYYPNDARLHKICVGVTWLLDAICSALMIFAVYHYAVVGFGDYLGLLVVNWSLKLYTVLNVVLILLVQSLYAYRIWLLSGYHHGILGYVTAVVVLGGFGIGTVFAYEIYKVQIWTDVVRVSWAIESAFTAATLIDIILAAAMCYYLRVSKNMNGQLNSRLSTLMQYTLSSGVLTSACSTAALFTYIFMHTNLVFLSLTWLLTRLYVNSFMAMMNARQRRGPGPGGENFDSLSQSRSLNQAVMLSPSTRSADAERQTSPMKAYELTEFTTVPTVRAPVPRARVPGPASKEEENSEEVGAYRKQW